MENTEVKLKVTLELDQEWAGHHSSEEVMEFIKHKMDYILGFRGRIKRLKPVKR